MKNHKVINNQNMKNSFKAYLNFNKLLLFRKQIKQIKIFKRSNQLEYKYYYYKLIK